jgi:hypothetical protein
MIRIDKAIGIAALLGCSLLLMDIGSLSEDHRMDSGKERVVFKLESADVSFDTADLNKMKAALQSFVDGPAFPPRYSEHREPMSKELKTAVPWVQDGEAGIGLWKLELRDRHLELIRRPPPSKGTQYIYHAALKDSASGWQIVSFEQEREFGPR